MSSDDKKATKTFTIHLDKKSYKVEGDSITGEQLRHVPTPAIGDNRDIYLEVSGHGEDDLIERHEVVHLKNGMHFFTAPSLINPGSVRAS